MPGRIFTVSFFNYISVRLHRQTMNLSQLGWILLEQSNADFGVTVSAMGIATSTFTVCGGRSFVPKVNVQISKLPSLYSGAKWRSLHFHAASLRPSKEWGTENTAEFSRLFAALAMIQTVRIFSMAFACTAQEVKNEIDREVSKPAVL
jgi:hypothetical protein